jgi:hypothetical protein
VAKGGNFENEICKQLSLAYSKGTRDDLFARTDGSGGKATRRRKKGMETANATGDIGIADVLGKPLIDSWCVECKSGYTKRNILKLGISFIKFYKKDSKIQEKWFKSIGAREEWLIKNKSKIGDVTELGGVKECDIPWDVLDLIDSQQKETQLEKFWQQCCRDAEITKREPVLIFRRNNRSTCIAFRTNYFGEPETDYGTYIYLSNLGIFIFNFKEYLKNMNFDFIINPLKDGRNEEKTEEIKTTCKPKTSRKVQLRGV